jgi:hypothetical protein
LRYAVHRGAVRLVFVFRKAQLLKLAFEPRRKEVMLNHLRQRVVDTVCAAETVTLSTCGPADIQANVFPCEALELVLYLLVPRTSDHLFNLEHNPEVVVTTAAWQLRGIACIAPSCPPGLDLLQRADAAWCHVVQVLPRRLQIEQPDGVGYAETIDVEVLLPKDAAGQSANNP